MPAPVLTDDHRYIVEGVGEVPGVTSIMAEMGLVKYWNRDPWYMERGRAVHAATRMIDLGKLYWPSVDPRIEGFLEAYEKFQQDTGIFWQYGEISLYHPTYRYCGTPDRWLPLCDIKCGQGDVIQLEAYADLLRVNGISPGKEGMLLGLNEDGSYKVTHHKYDRTLRSVWLSAVSVYNYRIGKGLI